MRELCLIALTATFATSASIAESTSPYADQDSRQIKALSTAEVADLLTGRGLGYAKAAELNGYPGPAHVLELADELQLSDRQRAESKAIFNRMAAAAKQTGANLISAERALDSAFRDRRITPQTLIRTVDEIGALDAALRAIHLQAHLEQTHLLTPGQIAHYQELRGYGDSASGTTHEHPSSK